jgi:hypothetical protein
MAHLRTMPSASQTASSPGRRKKMATKPLVTEETSPRSNDHAVWWVWAGRNLASNWAVLAGPNSVSRSSRSDGHPLFQANKTDSQPQLQP